MRHDVPYLPSLRAAAFAALPAMAVAAAAQELALMLAGLALALIAASAARDATRRETEIELRKARLAAAKAIYMARPTFPSADNVILLPSAVHAAPLLSAASVNVAPRRRGGRG